MDEIEVPSYFLCPISLEIMKDPVTISTGITYDRDSIEKWIFSGKHNTCPMTKQTLIDTELTPNITLRRVIQAWCTINAPYGIERFPTPKPPVSKAQVLKLLNDAKNPQKQKNCLQILKSIASQSETNKRCLEAAGAAEFLASIIKNTNQVRPQEESEDVHSCEEAISILHNLKLSENGLRSLFGKNDEFIGSLIRLMQNGSYESRAYAVMLLESMFEVADPSQLNCLKPEFFIEIVQVLHDQISYNATKAALKLLIDICPWGRNRIKAVEAGAVPLLINLLLDSTEKRPCEMFLIVLDQLCQCADGRFQLLNHAAGLAIVSKKIFRVSNVGSERAVRILHSILKFSASNGVLQDMLQLGVVTKLCVVLQVDCGAKTKEKAREILKLHARVWKNASCIPSNLSSSYPS